MNRSLHCPEEVALWRCLEEEWVPTAVQGHLAGCVICRRRLQRLQGERALLQRVMGGARDSDGDGRAPPLTAEHTAPAAGRGSPVVRAGSAAPLRIGRYPVTERLGAGGQADVFRGVHPTLGCPVVVKWARTSVEAEDRLREGIIREARILSRLDHPHLARVIDLDFHDDRPFLVLESVEGASLAAVLATRRLTEREILQLMLALTSAIEAAHGLGVLHLDLKPENVILSAGAEAKLIDFGTALLLRANDLTDAAGWICGTPEYMAPEQHTGDPDQLSERTDVFGLGQILKALLADARSDRESNGSAPEQAEDFAEDRSDAADVRSEPCQVELEIGESRGGYFRERLQEICERACAPNPEERFATAGELAAELGRLQVVMSTGRRRRMLASLLTLCGVLCLLVAGLAELKATGYLQPVRLRLYAGVAGAEDCRPLTESLPLVEGEALHCDIATPDPRRTRLYLFGGGGGSVMCQPLVAAASGLPGVSFPPQATGWRVRGLGECNLLLAGRTEDCDPPSEKELDQVFEGLTLQLAAEDNWLAVSRADRKAVRMVSARGSVSPEVSDATATLGRALRERLNSVFTQYEVLVFRCLKRPSVGERWLSGTAGPAPLRWEQGVPEPSW